MAETSKLQEIEKKVSKLYDKCKKEGFSNEQMLKAASPLLEFIEKAKRKRRRQKVAKIICCLAVIVGILAVFYQYDPAYRMLCVFAKLISIKTLSYYDWTDLYFTDCVLSNPYFKGDELSEEDCENCQDLAYIEVTKNVDPKDMTDYLFNNIPVVIADAVGDWKASQEFDLHFIKKLYTEQEVLSEATVCSLMSQTEDNFTTLMEGIGESIPQWNLRWRNCDIKANKVMRRYFHRPYFLPDMVEIVGSWIFMASGTARDMEQKKNVQRHRDGHDEYFSSIGWTEFRRNDNMQWMAQIRGHYVVSLTPFAPCNETCSQLSVRLNPGEILIFTPKMWLFEYMPYGEEDAIALASMGDWE